MKPSNWTIPYLGNRLRLAWYEFKNPDAPWITADAICFLESWLRPEDVVVEFGSGRSTLWLARRCGLVTSVEHDPTWFSAMSQKLAAAENVRYRYAPLRGAVGSDSPYLDVLLEVPAQSCDILLNDGRLRYEVAHQGISKLRPGGLHVLDNAERYLPNDLNVPASRGSVDPDDDWARFIADTEGWRRFWTCNGVSSTLFMFKPCS